MRDDKGRIATESERRILDIIYRNPGISRSALTRHTSWKQQSVHRMVDSLVARDLLTIGQAKIKGPGQPSPQLSINPGGCYALGISLNTDAIRLSLVNLGCELMETVFVETDPTDRSQALRDIGKATDNMLERHGIDRGQIVGLGFSITGYRLKSHDVFESVAPLHEWSEIPLSPMLAEALELPVWIENNANAGAIAESLVGAGRDHPTFCYLSFNFGFGGGMIVNGEPLLGAHGNAGELGTIFSADQRSVRPALEELIKRIRARGGEIESIRALNQKFHPDLPGVRDWVAEVMPMLELAIRAVSATTDPSAVVFGGEAPPGLQRLLIDACDPFRNQWKGRGNPAEPVLLQSSIEGDPATLGAALLPIKRSVLL